MENDIILKTEEIYSETVKIRRYLHTIPETAFNENKTSAYLLKKLKEYNVDAKRVGKTGVTGIVKGKNKDKVLGIRADIDANSLQEKNTAKYKSTHEKASHSCGHDVHMTVALAAMKILNNKKDRLNGTVKVIFQPAEEKMEGASFMIEKGVMENPRVDSCLGFHVWPEIDSNTIQVSPGPIWASGDFFEITVLGKGGHAAKPSKSTDCVLIACNIVNQLNTIVSRDLSYDSKSVLSVCSIISKDSFNIMPDNVKIRGTVRTLDKKDRKLIEKRINQVANGVSSAYNAKAEVNYNRLSPVLVNDAKCTKKFTKSAKSVLGENNVSPMDSQLTVSEDFAMFADLVPSVHFLLGCKCNRGNVRNSLHSPYFDVDENCIKTGIQAVVKYCLDYFN